MHKIRLCHSRFNTLFSPTASIYNVTYKLLAYVLLRVFLQLLGTVIYAFKEKQYLFIFPEHVATIPEVDFNSLSGAKSMFYCVTQRGVVQKTADITLTEWRTALVYCLISHKQQLPKRQLIHLSPIHPAVHLYILSDHAFSIQTDQSHNPSRKEKQRRLIFTNNPNIINHLLIMEADMLYVHIYNLQVISHLYLNFNASQAE